MITTVPFSVKKVSANPKAEMQWYKGNHKVKEGVKYTSRYLELGSDEYEILLEINVSMPQTDCTTKRRVFEQQSPTDNPLKCAEKKTCQNISTFFSMKIFRLFFHYRHMMMHLSPTETQIQVHKK